MNIPYVYILLYACCWKQVIHSHDARLLIVKIIYNKSLQTYHIHKTNLTAQIHMSAMLLCMFTYLYSKKGTSLCVSVYVKVLWLFTELEKMRR